VTAVFADSFRAICGRTHPRVRHEASGQKNKRVSQCYFFFFFFFSPLSLVINSRHSGTAAAPHLIMDRRWPRKGEKIPK